MKRSVLVLVASIGLLSEARALPLYVSLSGSNNPPYDSWANAATTIQAAVDASWPGAEIVVSDGVYRTGSIGPLQSAMTRVAVTSPVTLRSVNGPQTTIIQGNPESPGIRGVYVSSGAVVRGFTLMHGYAEMADGGGAWCTTNGTVSNCWVFGNTADGNGGGVYGGLVTGCSIQSNMAYSVGGGACGGIVQGCDISGNGAVFGGGVGSCSALNSVITRNSTPGDGGGAYYASLTHCTVVSNDASGWGGGVYGGDHLNCVIFGNSPVGGAFANWCYGSYTNCCTVPLPAGTGNFTNDPRLVNYVTPRLQSNSPCIDRVTNFTGIACDRDGVGRPLDGNGDGTNRSDVGAFEFVHPTADSDADGLSDSNEVFVLGSNAVKTDTDDDTGSDLYEFITGTSLVVWNPPASLFGVEADGLAIDGVIVAWPSVTGRLYTIYSATNLVDEWQATAVADWPGTGFQMSCTNAGATPHTYYRAKVRMGP